MEYRNLTLFFLQVRMWAYIAIGVLVLQLTAIIIGSTTVSSSAESLCQKQYKCFSYDQCSQLTCGGKSKGKFTRCHLHGRTTGMYTSGKGFKWHSTNCGSKYGSYFDDINKKGSQGDSYRGYNSPKDCARTAKYNSNSDKSSRHQCDNKDNLTLKQVAETVNGFLVFATVLAMLPNIGLVAVVLSGTYELEPTQSPAPEVMMQPMAPPPPFLQGEVVAVTGQPVDAPQQTVPNAGTAIPIALPQDAVPPKSDL
jgi:hypothetical protein